jgi:hypothetical protein
VLLGLHVHSDRDRLGGLSLEVAVPDGYVDVPDALADRAMAAGS